MNKFLKIFTYISLSIVFSPGLLNAQSDVDFMGVKLFETPYDILPQSDRVYTTHFKKFQTEYIAFEAEMRNNLYNIRSNTVKIYSEYYKSDGTLVGEPVVEYTLPSDWETAYLWTGWGWKEPGNWETGRYKVILLMDGKKLTEMYFTVSD